MHDGAAGKLHAAGALNRQGATRRQGQALVELDGACSVDHQVAGDGHRFIESDVVGSHDRQGINARDGSGNQHVAF